MLLSCVSLAAHAQEINHVATFGSAGGEVQFLPGGYIRKTEEGSTERYSYQGSSFRRVPGQLPAEIENWLSFDWGSVDFLNQIDREDFDPDLKAFVPHTAKVKKVIQIPLRNRKGTLILICYSRRSTERFVPPSATDLFVTGVLDTELDQQERTKYQKLWEKKVERNCDYGDFLYQQLPNGAELILLYSATVSGDSVDRTLDVYRLMQ